MPTEGVEPSRRFRHRTLNPARLPFRQTGLVPTEGVEPSRRFRHRSLNPARLPVPPGRYGSGITVPGGVRPHTP